MKIFNKSNIFDEKNIYLFYLYNLDNDYNDYLLILEYADNGTLRNYLKDNFNKLDWDIKLQFAIQIADVVSYMHQKDIIHRDLVSIFNFLINFVTFYFSKIKNVLIYFYFLSQNSIQITYWFIKIW